MHVYEINPISGDATLVIARTPHEASDLFAAWSAAHDRIHPSYTVKVVSLEALLPEQQHEVRRALTAGLVGIVHLDEDGEWTFSPPMWQPRDDGEEPIPQEDRGEVLRIFQMRDLKHIEAFVLASDYARASPLFEQHLRTHGHDTDDGVIYREVELQHLNEPANDAVYEALEIGHEGVVACGACEQWVFMVALGVQGRAPSDES